MCFDVIAKREWRWTGLRPLFSTFHGPWLLYRDAQHPLSSAVMSVFYYLTRRRPRAPCGWPPDGKLRSRAEVSKLFSGGPHKPTVQGPDIFHNAIFSGHVAIHHINNCFVNKLFFISDKISLRPDKMASLAVVWRPLAKGIFQVIWFILA